MGTELSEHQQLEAARQGNTQAFAALVRHNQDLVARTIKGMIGNHPDAEDLGQTVFIRFHNNLHRFRGDSSVGTYLCRIAINLCKNHVRKQMLLRKLGLLNRDEIDIPDHGPVLDLRERMRIALAEIPLKFREVLVLRYMQGFSMNDIAETLEIPLGTVLSRLSRAEKKLKEIWEERALVHHAWKKETAAYSYTV